MTRVLALIREDDDGEKLERWLREAAREGTAYLEVVRSWGAAIKGFLPDPPASFLIDVRMIGKGLPLREVRNIRSEFHQTRVVLLGKPHDLGGRDLRTLMKRDWIDELLTPEELSDPRRDGDVRDLFQASVAARMKAAVVQVRGGRPIPAVVDRALDAVSQVEGVGGPVVSPRGIAQELEVSLRTLNRRLRKGCGLTARDLVVWARVLRAVHELDRDPSMKARELARAVGYRDTTGLGRALDRRLGTRVEGARAMGFARALEKFSAELAAPESAEADTPDRARS